MDAIINIFKKMWLTLQRFWGFLIDVKNELYKVTWPGKQQVISSTIVVIIATLIVGVYLWLLDISMSFGISNILKFIIGAGN